ncbi:endonuclease MutS2 [Lacticigenium naphthae]|uniref:endonuclease MutS2 n=1 Tax=Lacticigenium naphthae TaxID=515351 RepID=UPI000488D5F5|nr:endonuclease MutS2 [Lacticigenium naphthae]
MNEKIKKTMEYEKVIQKIATYTVSLMGKTLIQSLEPQVTTEKVSQLQNETEDGRKILRLKGGIPIAQFANIRPHIKRLEMNASLNGVEIAEIGRVLSIARELKKFFDGMREMEIELNSLYDWADEIKVLKVLEKEIQQVVDPDGHIVDDASSKLMGIRTGIKQGEQRVKEKLESIIRGKSAKYLSDALITMRNDRYVIPVKQENKGYFGGVIHDQSSTGQTLFIEPKSVVDLNNKLRQLQIEERHEIERILIEISGKIAPYSQEIIQLIELLAQLDAVNAKAKFAADTNSSRPTIHSKNHVSLFKARHPLIPKDEVVENDILIGKEYKTMIITGPNTGGKTVALKTLGLLQLMGQAGLQIPAEEKSEIGIFTQIFADIGDEQSIEQSLSTFSSHMTNIVSILDKMDNESLILLDELGAGTDPQEGAALAIALLDKIGAIGSYVMVTSHYPELKAYGYNRPQTINASMEFNVETLSPTYRLLIGVPGRSNAFEIAQRLGLDKTVIDTAKELMSGDSQSVDQMIQDLESRRKMTELEYQEFRNYLDEAMQLYEDLKTAVKEFWSEREELMGNAEKKANKKIEEAQVQAEKIIKDLRNKQMQIGETAVKEHEFIAARSALTQLKSEEEKELAQNKVLKKAKRKKKLKKGDTVNVLSFDQKGVLIEQSGKNEWIVQMGMLKMKLNEIDLELTVEDREVPQRAVSTRSNRASVKNEVDVRGERAEDAIQLVDRYLDSALLANYPTVTIIHGVGTGVLRKVIHNYLKKHRSVKSYEIAPPNQGGAGATIVTFKS